MDSSDHSSAPPLGRYTLLPNTSSLDSLSEERQNVLSPAIPSEGKKEID